MYIHIIPTLLHYHDYNHLSVIILIGNYLAMKQLSCLAIYVNDMTKISTIDGAIFLSRDLYLSQTLNNRILTEVNAFH